MADKFFQVPPAADPLFKDSMTKLLSKHAVDFWIPVLDEEIIEASRLAMSASAPSTVIHTQEIKTAELCFDKLKMAAWLEQNGFDTPRTEPLRTAIWRAGGLFVKPRFGRGSVGAGLVKTRADFLMAKRSTGDLLAQEVANAPELTVDVFAPLRTGKVRAMCRERLEVKSGVCTEGEGLLRRGIGADRREPRGRS